MPEQSAIVERFWRPAAAIAAVAALAITGCSRQSGGHPGSVATPGISHSASPTPGADKAPADMADAQDSQLQILAGYESALHHNFDHEMYFTDMPRTVEEAESQADDMANTLKEYGKYGIKPLIIMEPTNNDGGNISLNRLHQPGYAHVLHSLFAGLKERGVTEEEMGTLTVMPEGDLPNWGASPHSTDPQLFAENYAAVAGAFRKVFPEGKLSVLLDSTAYPTGDVNYEHGDTSTASLMQYIDALVSNSKVPKINSLFFQGFPYNLDADPHDYLNSRVAIALARKLGVHEISFNTGSAASYGGHKVPTAIRREQLSGELAQAKVAKAAGFTVIFHVFGGKDADVSWNYPLTGNVVAAPLPGIVRAADEAGIEPALYADNK